MKILIIIFCLFFANYACAINISLVGSDSRIELLESWARENNSQIQEENGVLQLELKDKKLVITTPERNSNLIKTANLLYKSDGAFLVSDVTDGMLPQDRDHIIIARQSNTNIVGSIISRGHYPSSFDIVLNQEVFDTQTNEIRWLLSDYEMGDKQTPIYLELRPKDSLNGASGYGFADVYRQIKNMSPKPDKPYQILTTKMAYAHYYVLSDEETVHNALDLTKPTCLTIWSEGTTARILATPIITATAGGNAQVIIQAETPFKTGVGSRNFILFKNKLVGMGVVGYILIEN